MSQLEFGFSRGPMGQVDLEAFAQGYDILIGVDEDVISLRAAGLSLGR